MRKSTLMAAGAALALTMGVTVAAVAAGQDSPPKVSAAATAAAVPTAEDAVAFVAKAEADMAALSEYVNKSAWVRATYITEDTMWLEAKATAEYTTLSTRLAMEAAKFDKVEVDPATRRKLDILKRALVLPAPQRPGAAEEMATIGSRMDSVYSTGKFDHKGKPITLDDASALMASSRDPAELKALWEGWHSIAPPIKDDYAKLVTLANEGSQALGYKDTGALWRSGYDMSPDAFAAETDRLWKQIEPFYKNLHCYVRAELNEKYGDEVQPKTGPIRADLLGNMWAQQWGNIYDIVKPAEDAQGYDLDNLLQTKGYDATKMVRTGENFYVSMGLPALPETFWTRSQITRPEGREVVCHASAWDLDDRDDIRIKMCTRVTGDDFYTVHHELGHNYYQRAYKDQPYIFKGGANDGFHEAIGDFVGLSALTPTYLNQIGLLDTVPGAEGDNPFLLRMALDKIAFMPFGLLVDRWRWQVYDGTLTPETYNAGWWKLRTQYQGIVPPGPRPDNAFDPGAKYHVPANVPYTRYFLAHVYQFQFHRAACRQAGWKGPLHRCSVYGNKEVGARFNAMMEMGQSRPWPEALEAFTGEKQADATAVTEYFKPLNTWLTRQNRGRKCGW
ncbi:MAG: M2 family metallopeptidase [Caulobacter sp.]|jgi:peptidyl-dipeptidase A